MFDLFSEKNSKSKEKKSKETDIFGGRGYAERKDLRQVFAKMFSPLYPKPERKTLEEKFFPQSRTGPLVDEVEYNKAIRFWENKAKQSEMLGRIKEEEEARENVRLLKKAAGLK